MPSSVRELRVWQEAVGTAGEIAKLARKARPESRALVDVLIRCSAEVALAIARGHAKEGAIAQREGFCLARDAIASLETGLAIARHAELFPLPACADLGLRAGHTARLISGYVTYLDRLVEADAEAARSAVT
ncbi:MAG: four helix bundle protein [Gemmatimonadaceae bacterium]